MTPADATAAITHTLRLLPTAIAVRVLRDIANRWGLFRRSSEEHGLLFGVIGMAYDNWPDQHDLKPTDAEHLRSWLAIEVGHYNELELDQDAFRSITDAIALAMFFSDDKKTFRTGKRGDKLVVMRPRSMKEEALGVKEFRAMADRIYSVIQDITGITPELYKKEQDAQKRTTTETTP